MLTLIKMQGAQSGTFMAQEVIKLQIDPICWKTCFSFSWSMEAFHRSLRAQELKAKLYMLAILLGAVMMDRGAAGLLPE